MDRCAESLGNTGPSSIWSRGDGYAGGSEKIFVLNRDFAQKDETPLPSVGVL